MAASLTNRGGAARLDAARRSAYIAAVNLLLILSALLSALGGVFVGSPVTTAPVEHSIGEQRAAAIAPASIRSRRPAFALPALPRVAAPVRIATVAAVPGVALFAERRRE